MKRIVLLFALIFAGLTASAQNLFKYPLYVGVNGSSGGSIQLNGSTSGSALIRVAAAAGSVTFQLPTTNGTNGYVLTTNGSGTTSWAAAPSGMTYPAGSGIPLVVSGTSWGTTITNNSANWNTAYGWGNHASAGYAPSNNTTLTGTVTLPSTTSVGSVSSTEISYIDGATSNIQAQLNDTTILSTEDINTLIYTVKQTGVVTASVGITSGMLSRIIFFNTGSAIDITADPQIANGSGGQMITIIGSSDTNTLTLDDSAGLRLSGQIILGIGDTITLIYESTIGDWIEISRSLN